MRFIGKIFLIILSFFLFSNKSMASESCSWIVAGGSGADYDYCRSYVLPKQDGTILEIKGETVSADRCDQSKKPDPTKIDAGKSLFCCCPKVEKVEEKGKELSPDLNPLGNMQVKIPGLDKLAEQYPIQCEENELGSKVCKIPWIPIYIYAIYNYFLAIGGILAALALMIGGVIWLVSAGNASRVSDAKSWITGSVTGLIILLTSYVLLYQINPELIGMKYVELESIKSYDIPLEAQIQAPETGPSTHGVVLRYQCSESSKKIVYNQKGGPCPEIEKFTSRYGTQANPISPYKGTPNLCTSGCGILSTFMAVNKYSNESNLERFTRMGESMGARGANCDGSAAPGLIALAKAYGLSAGYTSGKESISQKIDEGCVVVISLRASGDSCAFTNGGHFILLTGWREKHNMIVDVADPQGNTPYPYKGQCQGGTSGNPALCKTWLSLNNWGGCSLNQQFYVCGK
jgi:hypothetical protein